MIILPCPFCGFRAEVERGVGEYWVGCQSCRNGSKLHASPSDAIDDWNRLASMPTEKEWTDILAGLSLGDVSDRPRFVAYDESYCLSRHDCAKMAQQLARHFAPRQASNHTDHQAPASGALVHPVVGCEPSTGAR